MIVLDASVIAKWFLQEDGGERALRYRDLRAEGKEHILVPAVLLYELANLFAYKADFSDEDSVKAFKSLAELGLEIVHFYFDDAVRLAIFSKQKDITAYDAAYIDLALRFNCRFVTADEKLFKKISDLGAVELLKDK